MITYFFILLFYFSLNIFSSLCARKEIMIFRSKRVDIFYYFFVIFLILFSGFRFGVGWDYNQYYSTIFYDLETNIITRGEFLTIELVEFTKKIGITNFYFFINSFITIFLISLVIDKYSVNKWLSILLFLSFPLFFLNSLSIIRFFTALSIVFYSIKYMENKNLFKFSILVYIASLFHGSALIAFLLYFFLRQQLSIFKLIILMLISFSSSHIINIVVNNYFPQYASYTELTNKKEGTLAIYFFMLILISCIPILSKINKDNISRLCFNAFFFGFLIYLAFFGQGSMSHRLSLFGTIFCLILIPKIIEYYSSDIRVKYLIIFVIYVFLSFMFLYSVHIGAETYIPYKTIFSLY